MSLSNLLTTAPDLGGQARVIFHFLKEFVQKRVFNFYRECCRKKIYDPRGCYITPSERFHFPLHVGRLIENFSLNFISSFFHEQSHLGKATFILSFKILKFVLFLGEIIPVVMLKGQCKFYYLQNSLSNDQKDVIH